MPANDGFDFHDGDLELTHYVYQLVAAHVGHLSTLTGRSEIALRRRLRKLRKRRYLAAIGRHFMQKKIYAIGSQGIASLVEAGFAPSDLKEKRLRHNEITEFGLRHRLHLSGVHVRLLMLTRGGPIKMTLWREGPSLWDTVTPAGADAPLPVRPDAYVVLQHTDRPEGKNKFHLFIEADRSSMSHARMAAKISAYLAYYEQKLSVRKYPGMQSFVVATITETRSRADELRKDLHPLIPHAAWRQAYPFVALEDLTAIELLLPKAAADRLTVPAAPLPF